MVEQLNRPDIFQALQEVISIDRFEGQVLNKNGERLKALLLDEINEHDDTKNL